MPPLLLAALLAPGLQAQTCFDFSAFCDGLELTEVSGELVGEWVSYDCAGSRETMSGPIAPTEHRGRVLCGDAGIGTCDVSGPDIDWGFVLKARDLKMEGTMDMFQSTDGGATWSIWIDDLEYVGSDGPCTFLADSPFGSHRARSQSLSPPAPLIARRAGRGGSACRRLGG